MIHCDESVLSHKGNLRCHLATTHNSLHHWRCLTSSTVFIFFSENSPNIGRITFIYIYFTFYWVFVCVFVFYWKVEVLIKMIHPIRKISTKYSELYQPSQRHFQHNVFKNNPLGKVKRLDWFCDCIPQDHFWSGRGIDFYSETKWWQTHSLCSLTLLSRPIRT